MTESRKFSATPSAKLLLAVAALLAAVVLYQVAEFFMGLACAELAVAQATEVGATGPNNLEAHLTQAKSVSDS